MKLGHTIIGLNDGRIKYVSPTMLKKLGYDKKQVVGKMFVKFVDQKSLLSSMKQFNEIINTGKYVKSLVIWLKCKKSKKPFKVKAISKEMVYNGQKCLKSSVIILDTD